MLFEATIKFKDKKPFIFRSKADIKLVEKDVPYEMLISLREGQLHLLRNQSSILCTLHTEIYECRALTPNSFMAYRPRNKRKQGSEDVDVLELTTDSKALIELLQEKTAKKVLTIPNVLSYSPAKQQHTSLLSTESPEQKYRGLVNLAAIILVVMNLRSIIDNFQKYGNQFVKGEIKIFNGNGVPATLVLPFFVIFQYQIEKWFFQQSISRQMNRILTWVNICAMLLLHMWFCRVFPMLPFPGVGVTTLVLVIALKLTSFYQHNTEVLEMVSKLRKIKTNENYRDLFGMQEIDNANLQILVKNKDNLLGLLDWKHYCYFMVAPTLCYQLSYPRNASIRPVWIIKRLLEYVIVFALELVLWVQYYMPALDELVLMINTGNYTVWSVVYKIIQMSIPTILMWLAMFYMLFQVHLNILAELLRFADRRFYQDWWNCKTIAEYWRLWNLPVHYWCVRHVYNPLLKKGVNRNLANFSVFFVSAIAHEYLVSVPLGLSSYWAFLAMMLQSPLVEIELILHRFLKLEDSQLGNVTFWITVCVIGEPICVSIYYYLYVSTHG